MNILKKKHDLRLHKWGNGVILLGLLVYTAYAADSNGRFFGTAPTANATVRLQPQDALRLTELNRLREEAAAAKEALKLLELETETLREEKQAIRRELIDVSGKYQKEKEDFRELKLWLAGIPGDGEVRKDGRREVPLLETLSAMRKDGATLAMKSTEVSEEAWKLIRELPIGKVRQAEFRLKLDELARISRRFIAVSESGEADGKFSTLRTCRILAVDRKFGLAVLSAGSLHGVFPGMTYLSGKDRSQRLKVVSVRPLIAAAVVTVGDVESLAPGMEAAAGVTLEPGGAGSAGNGSKK